MPHYGDYQNTIYGAGLRGVVPRVPVDFATLEARALEAMPPFVRGYVQGGCGDEHTQRINADAFRHWGMVPRMMVDTRERDLSCELFGQTYPSPLFISDIGFTVICTPDGHGDLHAARAAAETGVPLCASTLSNDPLEEVAKAQGATPGFFQLYTPKDEEVAASLVGRAEAAGYRAIVVTLDTWVTGWRPRALNAANGDVAQVDIAAIAVTPWFVPATTSLKDQLQAFRRRRTHVALVVDEYGIVKGLVTLEDIIEEIVGDIKDEHDLAVQGVRPQADGSVLVEGSVPIRDLNRVMAWDLPDDAATTIAGLVIHEVRAIPESGQVFTFHGFRFEVQRKVRNRIASLRVVPAPR